MCLIAFALNQHEQYPFILIANRDEFYDRPTKSAHWWSRDQFYGGKDLKAGGTWMGLSPTGKFAAVTNYRDPDKIDPKARSRGDLPVNFLSNGQSATEYLNGLDSLADEYNGFNLLLSDFQCVWHYSNYENKINLYENGVHGLSNALMNSDWPKVNRTKSELTAVLSADFSQDDLFELLRDSSVAEDVELPKTGVPRDWEKALSAICIKTENYGTCSSSVVTVDRKRKVSFTEKTYAVGDRKANVESFQFSLT